MKKHKKKWCCWKEHKDFLKATHDAVYGQTDCNIQTESLNSSANFIQHHNIKKLTWIRTPHFDSFCIKSSSLFARLYIDNNLILSTDVY